MPKAEPGRSLPVYRNFPPVIYEAMLGTAVAIVAVCWLFFAEDLSSAVPAAAITYFTLVSLGLPLGLWLLTGDEPSHEELRTWMNGRFEIWQTWLKGRDAALLALLPLVSVAVGLALISLIAQLVADRVI